METTDELLISACKHDLRHFADIYKKYLDHVYRYSYSVLQSQEETEDIVGMTFETALNKISAYEYKGISLKSWLFQIARFHMSNKFRLKSNDNQSFDESIFTEYQTEDIALKAVNTDLLNRIEEYIKEYPAIIQEILTLRLWQEMEFTEIAMVIGRKPGAVKMNYYRTLEKIQEKFAEGGL